MRKIEKLQEWHKNVLQKCFDSFHWTDSWKFVNFSHIKHPQLRLFMLLTKSFRNDGNSKMPNEKVDFRFRKDP